MPSTDEIGSIDALGKKPNRTGLDELRAYLEDARKSCAAIATFGGATVLGTGYRFSSAPSSWALAALVIGLATSGLSLWGSFRTKQGIVDSTDEEREWLHKRLRTKLRIRDTAFSMLILSLILLAISIFFLPRTASSGNADNRDTSRHGRARTSQHSASTAPPRFGSPHHSHRHTTSAHR